MAIELNDGNNPKFVRHNNNDKRTVIHNGNIRWQRVVASFNSNGGSPSFPDQSIIVGQDTVSNPGSPSKVNYTFTGWGVTFPATRTVDTTFTAQYTPINYTITYVLNGGTNGSNPGTYNVESNITFDNPTKTRTGYTVTFAGWYLESSFTTQITGITPGTRSGNLTIYAKWTEIPITYTIAFNANGGTGTAPTNVTATYDSAWTAPANPFTRTGYTFGGWNVNTAGTGTTYAASTSHSANLRTSPGTVTLYAKWTPINYSISYSYSPAATANSPVTNNGSNPSTYTIESSTITFAAASRSGYTFTSWNPTSIPSGSTGNKSTIGSFSIINYTISYVLNGGTNNGSNPASYNIESPTITFAAPTRTGYQFSSWSLASIVSGSTGNKSTTAS
jgi:uncharacterized repeat protein (TIGR02543 family)